MTGLLYAHVSRPWSAAISRERPEPAHFYAWSAIGCTLWSSSATRAAIASRAARCHDGQARLRRSVARPDGAGPGRREALSSRIGDRLNRKIADYATTPETAARVLEIVAY